VSAIHIGANSVKKMYLADRTRVNDICACREKDMAVLHIIETLLPLLQLLPTHE